MLKAVRACFANYATFSGRARRPEYWWFVLFCILLSAFAAGLDGLVFGPQTASVEVTADGSGAAAEAVYGGGPISGFASLATLLPFLAVGWRRMHDAGRPGWLFLLPMLVGLGGMLLAATAGVAFGPAAPEAAGAGMMAVMLFSAIASLGATALLVYWLTRPSEPGPNAYGPEPAPW
jgi:uncharacterized membrane protein YhaH (DUF805 family)